jgi:hypothetical protein
VFSSVLSSRCGLWSATAEGKLGVVLAKIEKDTETS